MRKFVTTVVLLLSMAILLSPTARAGLSLTPTDDTYVDLNDPDTNKDGFSLLADYSNTPGFTVTRRAYLRFDLSVVYKDLGDDTLVMVHVASNPLFTTGTWALWSTGDDWNGTTSGNGDETTLTWNNAPAGIAKLDTQATLTGNWLVFTSSALKDYINSQRKANSGDGIASFMIKWDSCTTCSSVEDNITFEDHEDANSPMLVPAGPSAVGLSTFRATSPAVGWVNGVAGLGLLAMAVLALTLYRRRR